MNRCLESNQTSYCTLCGTEVRHIIVTTTVMMTQTRLIGVLLLLITQAASNVAAVAVPATSPNVPSHKKMGSDGWTPLEAMRGGAKEENVVRRFAGSSSDTRMPSLFSPDEAEYNKFAACLAATEGIRRMRDQALLELEYSLKRRGDRDEDSLRESQYEIGAHYQAISGKVLRALGMSVERFNELGQEISASDRLKEKVRYLVMISQIFTHIILPSV